MLVWTHKMLISVFAWFALGAFGEEKRLSGKALWMYLGHHRPDEAVIVDGFHSIAFNFVFLLMAGFAVVWLERRNVALATPVSPADARAVLHAPKWFETVHRAIERLVGK